MPTEPWTDALVSPSHLRLNLAYLNGRPPAERAIACDVHPDEVLDAIYENKFHDVVAGCGRCGELGSLVFVFDREVAVWLADPSPPFAGFGHMQPTTAQAASRQAAADAASEGGAQLLTDLDARVICSIMDFDPGSGGVVIECPHSPAAAVEWVGTTPRADGTFAEILCAGHLRQRQSDPWVDELRVVAVTDAAGRWGPPAP